MNGFFSKHEKAAPEKGYILPHGNYSSYRATAVAYMERERIRTVENVNGNWYTLTHLKNSMIK